MVTSYVVPNLGIISRKFFQEMPLGSLRKNRTNITSSLLAENVQDYTYLKKCSFVLNGIKFFFWKCEQDFKPSDNITFTLQGFF